MATYYVKPTTAGGDDDAAGDSPLRAWASLARAAQRRWQPGDTLLIAPATYPNTGKSEFRGGGDPARPVIIAGDGSRPTIVFDAALDTDPKFVVSGVGFELRDIACTQPVRAYDANDRMLCAQPAEAHPTDIVSDVSFLRCAAWECYQPLKAADAPRTRFIGCEAYDCTIAVGLVGTSDDSSIEECFFHGFAEDAVQTKGGVRNPRVLRCTIVGDAVSGSGIVLGGSSTFVVGNPWGRPDADYEAANALAANNIIIGVPEQTMYAGIKFQGAKNSAALNNTLVNLPGCTLWTDGIMDGIDVKTSAGDGWALGAPATSGVTVANNLLVYLAATMENHQAPGGANVWRDNLSHLTNWVTGEGDWLGTWTAAGNATGDPSFVRYADVTAWGDLDLRLRPDSAALEFGAFATAPTYDETGEHSAAMDRDGLPRLPGRWDAGGYDATARRQRKQRHPVRRGRR